MTDLKQLKCPSCGAVLSLTIPDQIVIECPYCHQQVVNSNAYKSAKGGEEPRILEFKLKLKDVVKRLIDNLVKNQSVPKDIFEKMKISSIKQYYVPMFFFEGTYRAPWSATIERFERRQRIGYDGKIEDYYETLYDYPSGEAAGNFSCNCVPDDVLERLRLDARDITINDLSPSSLPAFSQVTILEGVDLLVSSHNAESVWRESGEGKARGRGIAEAEFQARGNMTNCSASCELKKSWMVYIPIWIIRYEYQRESYCYVYSAEQGESISNPSFERYNEDDDVIAQPSEEQQIVLDRYEKREKILTSSLYWGCFGCVLCILSLFVGKIFDIDFLNYLSFHGYFFKFIFAGLVLFAIISIVSSIFKKKDGIDDIKADIDNRTRILQENAENRRNKELYEAEKYRYETGQRFLNAFSGTNVGNNFDETKREKDEYYKKNAKYCIKCGKEINPEHKFCRYCGTKLH